MAMKLVTAPSGDVVTLAEVKAHLRVDFTDDDDLIQAMINAAVDSLDGPNGSLKIALLDQTWDFYLDAFPVRRAWNGDCNAADLNRIDIPLAPVIEVTGVFYTDTNGVEQEFDAGSYVLDAAANPPRLTLANGAAWPSPAPIASAVRIRVRAGHIDDSSPPVANVPAAVKAAIKILVGDFYDNRGSFVVGQTVSQFPRAVEWLLQKANNSRGFA